MNFIYRIISVVYQFKQFFSFIDYNKYIIQFKNMSKILQSVASDIKKSRNLAYYGRYQQSRDEFAKVIDILQRQIVKIKDKILAQQWNKLLFEMKKQKSSAQEMLDIISGTYFQAPNKKIVHNLSQVERPIKGNENVRENTNQISQNEEPKQQQKKKYPFNRQPFKKAHDDEQLDQKERDPDIWDPPPSRPKNPTKKKVNPPPPKLIQNTSNVDAQKKKDQYQKPWKHNAKKPAAKTEDKNQKKTFLKDRYPEGNGPDADLINMLQREVIDLNPNVSFDDIAQLQKAKQLLQQAVLLPLQAPQLFKGIRKPWKGVLMFGPPGTGKTMLAKAIASTGKTTFFNVTSSSLASKWKGQSQKLVRILFQMAKFYAPSTVFIDEIDALASKRGQKDDESSRKVKTQLLTRMDGANTGDDEKKIVVIGATNRPWDIDEAIRRRLQKRIYIPLPTQIGRRQLFRIYLKNQKLAQDFDLETVVGKSNGYSGADIANLCRQAAYMPMRRKLKKQGGWKKVQKNMVNFEQQVNIPLTMSDFIEAIGNVKASVGTQDLQNYQDWMKQFGEQGTK